MLAKRSVLYIHVYIYALGLICCIWELRLHVYIRVVLVLHCMLKGWKSRFQLAQVSETAVRAFIWREMPEHVKIVEQERFRGERQSCARQKRQKRGKNTLGAATSCQYLHGTTLTWHGIIFQFDTNCLAKWIRRMECACICERLHKSHHILFLFAQT